MLLRYVLMVHVFMVHKLKTVFLDKLLAATAYCCL